MEEKFPPGNGNKDDDRLFFADEPRETVPEVLSEHPPWKVIIADDEPSVHDITKIVMEDYVFENRKPEFISAYSGEETRKCIREHPDTAIILLDVVMEEKNSGLEAVRYIREELGNRFVRIILRTGQPGEAPESEIITKYDINDYKEKTELTAQKLFTTVTSALRAYRDLRVIEKNRRGLEQIIESSARLFEIRSLKKFAKGALTQLVSILGLDETSLYFQTDGFTALKEGENGDFRILAATGKFEQSIGCSILDVVSEDVRQYMVQAICEEKSFFRDNFFIGYFPAKTGGRKMLYLSGCRNLTETDRDLIRVFSTNLAIAFDNIFLNREIVETQKEVVLTLGEVVETRSKETANHVHRVAEYSFLLAVKAGLGITAAKLIRMASPLHDIGKVGIPDAILLKKEKLTPEEFDLIKTHVSIGYDILKNSHREIMQAAAVIAQQHHERWNGQGYMQGLKGEEIHIYARITTLADIFDALSNIRSYKDAWKPERILNYFRNEREKIFDPALTDIFLKNAEEFFAIKQKYAAQKSGCR
ncbi:MAG: DUF3369 domain-containing protein [Desulfococcaceae bacterium]